MRYLATDLYAFLLERGCIYDGERYPHGEIWATPGMQVFFLPDPDLFDGVAWFDADVIDENLRDRWAGFELPLPIKRHP